MKKNSVTEQIVLTNDSAATILQSLPTSTQAVNPFSGQGRTTGRGNPRVEDSMNSDLAEVRQILRQRFEASRQEQTNFVSPYREFFSEEISNPMQVDQFTHVMQSQINSGRQSYSDTRTTSSSEELEQTAIDTDIGSLNVLPSVTE